MKMMIVTHSPDRQSVCGVIVGPPHQLHTCSQSPVPAHLHLDTEGEELRHQRLQDLFR